MFDWGLIGGVAIGLMVLVCPLMMIVMMGMAMFPMGRRLHRGHGGMMCHGGAHGEQRVGGERAGG